MTIYLDTEINKDNCPYCENHSKYQAKAHSCAIFKEDEVQYVSRIRFCPICGSEIYTEKERIFLTKQDKEEDSTWFTMLYSAYTEENFKELKEKEAQYHKEAINKFKNFRLKMDTKEEKF